MWEEDVPELAALRARVATLEAEMQAERRRYQRGRLLQRAAWALTSQLELETLCSRILEEVPALLEIKAASVWIIAPETGKIVCHVASGQARERVEAWQLERGMGIIGWVVEQGRSLLLDDAQEDERHYAGVDEVTGLTTRSLLTVPLEGRGEIIGALQLLDERSGRFSEEDCALAEALGGFAAIAIENARLHQEARQELEERRRTEAALRHSEARYRSVFENGVLGIYQSTPEGRFLALNPALARMLGYASPAEALEEVEDIARQFYLDPERRALMATYLREHLEEPLTLEQPYRRRGGEEWIARISLRWIEDGTYETPYLEGFVQDITDRVRAEKALRAQEAKFRSLVEQSYDGIVLVDEDGAVRTWNTGIERITGLPRVQALGCTLWDLLFRMTPSEKKADPELYFTFRRQIREVLATGSVCSSPVENQIERPDGSQRFVQTLAFPIITPEGAMLGAIVRDITQRRQAEQSLRESEARFRRMANTAPVLIWISGAEGLCTYFNQPWLEFRGRTLEEEVGEGWTEGLHPEDRTACLATYAAALAAREPFTMEYRLRRADGTYRWLLDKGTPRYTPEGTFVGYIGAGTDITEQKRAEEAEHQYTRRLRALSARLNELQESERQRLAQELHDQVGQNLTALGIDLNIVQSQLVDKAVPEAHTRLKDAQGLVESITDSIRDVMGYLRPPVLDDYGLAASLRWYGREFQSRTGVVVEVDTKAEEARFSPRTEVGLFRIAQEALTNVAKHAQAGHVTLRLRADEHRVRLEVVDDGCGFCPPEPANGGAGKGWGLLVMRERAEGLGGRFELHAQPDAGTRIFVEVPQ